jgi:succinoglycan biosynthesis transport protein ExoP
VAEPGITPYLGLLRRNLWILVLTVALATITAVFLSVHQSKVYRSSADVFLGSQSITAAVTGTPTGSDPLRTAATQAALARTPAVAERALGIARLTGRSAGDLLGHSSVSPASNADILRFTVDDSQPVRAERLAQDYALAYTRYRRQLDTATLSQATRSLEKQLAQLRASGLSKTTAYADLVDKAQQLRTLEVLQGSNALLVRSAGPAAQIQPRPTRNGAVAAALGLLLGLGLVLLREALNTRVRTAAEAHKLLDLPQLGRLPEPPRRFRGPRRLVMLTEPHSPGAEAYRILATNLDFVNLERGARTIMFTGATHSEGKSTTAANLAVAYARAGRRVVLADLDLRSPTLGSLFDLSDHAGVTSLALGRVELADALVSIQLEGEPGRGPSDGVSQGLLEVLPVGPVPPNPAEFIGSHSLAMILAELTKRADLVLIDAPPILDLSDAMTLTSRVDGLVVVTRLPTTRRSALQELRRVLGTAPTAKLGFVATGTTSEPEAYGAYGYANGATAEVAAFSKST